MNHLRTALTYPALKHHLDDGHVILVLLQLFSLIVLHQLQKKKGTAGTVEHPGYKYKSICFDCHSQSALISSEAVTGHQKVAAAKQMIFRTQEELQNRARPEIRLRYWLQFQKIWMMGTWQIQQAGHITDSLARHCVEA